MKSLILAAAALASASLVSLLIFHFFLKLVSAADPGKEKLAKMEKLEYSASNGIIIFNDKNYE
jgi:hypothetical protein